MWNHFDKRLTTFEVFDDNRNDICCRFDNINNNNGNNKNVNNNVTNRKNDRFRHIEWNVTVTNE